MASYAYPLMNTTGLKASSHHNYKDAELLIHGVYRVYLMTMCRGYHVRQQGLGGIPANAGASMEQLAQGETHAACLPSVLLWYHWTDVNTAKFIPLTLISVDWVVHNCPENATSLVLPANFQDAFNERFNFQPRMAFIFYVIDLMCAGKPLLSRHITGRAYGTHMECVRDQQHERYHLALSRND